MNNRRSAELFETAKKIIPGGLTVRLGLSVRLGWLRLLLRKPKVQELLMLMIMNISIMLVPGAR